MIAITHNQSINTLVSGISMRFDAARLILKSCQCFEDKSILHGLSSVWQNRHTWKGRCGVYVSIQAADNCIAIYLEDEGFSFTAMRPFGVSIWDFRLACFQETATKHSQGHIRSEVAQSKTLAQEQRENEFSRQVDCLASLGSLRFGTVCRIWRVLLRTRLY